MGKFKRIAEGALITGALALGQKEVQAAPQPQEINEVAKKGFEGLTFPVIPTIEFKDETAKEFLGRLLKVQGKLRPSYDKLMDVFTKAKKAIDDNQKDQFANLRDELQGARQDFEANCSSLDTELYLIEDEVKKEDLTLSDEQKSAIEKYGALVERMNDVFVPDISRAIKLVESKLR